MPDQNNDVSQHESLNNAATGCTIWRSKSFIRHMARRRLRDHATSHCLRANSPRSAMQHFRRHVLVIHRCCEARAASVPFDKSVMFLAHLTHFHNWP